MGDGMISFSLTFNEHKNYYEAADEYLARLGAKLNHDVVGSHPTEESLYVLQVYPDTPVGFVLYVSGDMDAVLDVVRMYREGEL